jgi:hypothetical protein
MKSPNYKSEAGFKKNSLFRFKLHKAHNHERTKGKVTLIKIY